jgi:hypothetical protein
MPPPGSRRFSIGGPSRNGHQWVNPVSSTRKDGISTADAHGGCWLVRSRNGICWIANPGDRHRLAMKTGWNRWSDNRGAHHYQTVWCKQLGQGRNGYRGEGRGLHVIDKFQCLLHGTLCLGVLVVKCYITVMVQGLRHWVGQCTD